MSSIAAYALVVWVALSGEGVQCDTHCNVSVLVPCNLPSTPRTHADADTGIDADAGTSADIGTDADADAGAHTHMHTRIHTDKHT